MGRITNLIPLLTDSHTSTYKKAFHRTSDRKTVPKIMLFFNIEKNIDNWDGLGRGERSEGQSKPHSDGLIQLF